MGILQMDLLLDKERRYMKRLLQVLCIFSWAVSGYSATATFNYTFSNPVCSATVSTNCVSGFAVGTVAAGVFTQMAVCPLPSATTGNITGITCTFTGTSPLGSVTFAVLATYVGATMGTGGNSPLTASAETSVMVTPSSPSGVVIVFP